jgi:hypothetical protein
LFVFGRAGERGGKGWVIPSSGAKGQERRVGFLWMIGSGPVGKASGCIRKEKHEEEVLNRIGTTGGFDKTLQARPTT